MWELLYIVYLRLEIIIYSTMELNRALRLVLITLLKDQVTVASWGISNIVIKPSVLTFNVDGMKFKGIVSVKVTGTTYTLHIGKDSYSNLDLNTLVGFMDERIECTTDYLSDLRKWLVQKA